MAENENVNPERLEEASLGMTVAAAVIGGASGGVAGAATTQLISKVTGADKPKEESKK